MTEELSNVSFKHSHESGEVSVSI